MSAIGMLALSVNLVLLFGLALAFPSSLKKNDVKMIAACVVFAVPAALAVIALYERL